MSEYSHEIPDKPFLGVIGDPISHSLSPIMHNYWLQKYGIEADYKLFQVRADELNSFINQVRNSKCIGLNVTVPHKTAIIDSVDECSLIVKKINAVNTLSFSNKIIYGNNTDIEGFKLPIQDKVTPNTKVVLIGAGGAAKAICAALCDFGVRDVDIVNRSQEKASTLLDSFNFSGAVYNYDDTSGYLEDCDLLINTTSLGNKGMPDLAVELDQLKANSIVYDIIYNPYKTTLLQNAKKLGHHTINGLPMLIGQARKSFGIWFDILPDYNQTDPLNNILLDHLNISRVL